MAVNVHIGPKPQHWKLYERRRYRAPGLTIPQRLFRLLLIALGTIVVTLMMPFTPSFRPNRHLPATIDEYTARLIPSFIVAMVIACGAFYEYITKPLRNHQLGYRLFGRFVVRGKQKMFGKAWLELEPDDSHHVRINLDAFDHFQKGDTVEVVYSATGDFISLRKINEPAAKP